MAGNSGQLGANSGNSGCPHGEGCACAKAGAKVFAVPSVALAKLKAGQTARVCEACVDPRDAALLRAMGLRPNALIRVCRVGEPCIVEVVAVSGGADSCEGKEGGGGGECACRIGLARPLAEKVMVDRVSDEGKSAT